MLISVLDLMETENYGKLFGRLPTACPAWFPPSRCLAGPNYSTCLFQRYERYEPATTCYKYCQAISLPVFVVTCFKVLRPTPYVTFNEWTSTPAVKVT